MERELYPMATPMCANAQERDLRDPLHTVNNGYLRKRKWNPSEEKSVVKGFSQFSPCIPNSSESLRKKNALWYYLHKEATKGNQKQRRGIRN